LAHVGNRAQRSRPSLSLTLGGRGASCSGTAVIVVVLRLYAHCMPHCRDGPALFLYGHARRFCASPAHAALQAARVPSSRWNYDCDFMSHSRRTFWARLSDLSPMNTACRRRTSVVHSTNRICTTTCALTHCILRMSSAVTPEPQRDGLASGRL